MISTSHWIGLSPSHLHLISCCLRGCGVSFSWLLWGGVGSWNAASFSVPWVFGQTGRKADLFFCLFMHLLLSPWHLFIHLFIYSFILVDIHMLTPVPKLYRNRRNKSYYHSRSPSEWKMEDDQKFKLITCKCCLNNVFFHCFCKSTLYHNSSFL